MHTSIQTSDAFPNMLNVPEITVTRPVPVISVELAGVKQAKAGHSKLLPERAERFENNAGTGVSKKQLEDVLNHKGFKNYNLIQGNVFDTLDEYLLKKPELRLSLLHLDLDVAEPTKYVLNTLYERLVRGGLVVIDDYNDVEGATKVVDDFVQKHNLTINTLSFYGKPVFIKKP